MRYFDDSIHTPNLKALRLKLIREKEENIRDDIRRLNHLKKINAVGISREQLLKVFHTGVERNNFSKEMF
jgi:hypothetical protein